MPAAETGPPDWQIRVGAVSLKWLFLVETQVTDEEIEKLKRALPKLGILR